MSAARNTHQLCQTGAGLEALFSLPSAGKEILYGFHCVRTNEFCPGDEFVGGIVQILPVGFRHMLRALHQNTLQLVQLNMCREPRLFIEHLNNLANKAIINHFTNHTEGEI